MEKNKSQERGGNAEYAMDVGVLLSSTNREIERRVCQRTAEQTQVNEALVAQILARQQVEETLRQSQKQLSELIEHQAQIKEDERKRIARDIHDELGQNLLALRLDISRLQERTRHSHPRLHKHTCIALNNIDLTIKSVKAIINNLRPFILELGLQAAINWQLDEFSRVTGLAYRLHHRSPENEQIFSDEQTLAIFRILQESLNNIAQHARASTVEVSLGFSADHRHFFMDISDDGIGISAADIKKHKSFGLAGIRERLHAFDGQLIIDSSPATGSTLSISVPVRNASFRTGNDIEPPT
jgi:signal transduction histidine kinase